MTTRPSPAAATSTTAAIRRARASSRWASAPADPGSAERERWARSSHSAAAGSQAATSRRGGSVAAGAAPQRARAGLQECGLPYAAGPAVTRHLATFLARHGSGEVAAVLFNGGAMTTAPVGGSWSRLVRLASPHLFDPCMMA